MDGSSKPLQGVSLAGLMSDPYSMAKCHTIVNESYYENISYKLIYKCLSMYYKKYLITPSHKEMAVMIDELHTDEYGDKQEAVRLTQKIFEDIGSYSEEFLYDKVREFIRRNKIERTLSKVLTHVKTGNIDLDEFLIDIKDSIDINFSKSTTYRLSDVDNLIEIREEALGSSDNPVTVKFFIDAVNKCMQYGALIPGTLNLVVGPPGRGKTTLAINQGLHAAKQGLKSLHVFLGDMKRFDGLLRYVSCLSGASTRDLVNMSNDDLKKFIIKWNMTGVLDNVEVVSYPPETLNIDELIEEIRRLQKENRVHYSQIIVDYDENISEESDNMYKSSGMVYNKLSAFSEDNKSVVFILSQPKPDYWKNEVIPLEGAAESSKKQKIIDLMITLGRSNRECSVGTLNLAKNRRGEDGKLFRILLDGSSARIEHITEDEYQRIRQSHRNSENSNTPSN